MIVKYGSLRAESYGYNLQNRIKLNTTEQNRIEQNRRIIFSLNHYFAISLPYPIQPYPTLPYPILPYPILLYPTLPYPTLPYPILTYPTLPYPDRKSVV